MTRRAYSSIFWVSCGLVACALAPRSAIAQPTVPHESATVNSPVQHLASAKTILDSIPKNVPKDAAKLLDELRTHFAALDSAYRVNGSKIGPPITPDPTTSEPRHRSGARSWQDTFSDVERDLT